MGKGKKNWVFFIFTYPKLELRPQVLRVHQLKETLCDLGKKNCQRGERKLREGNENKKLRKKHCDLEKKKKSLREENEKKKNLRKKQS
jgi:hypothetical protein